MVSFSVNSFRSHVSSFSRVLKSHMTNVQKFIWLWGKKYIGSMLKQIHMSIKNRKIISKYPCSLRIKCEGLDNSCKILVRFCREKSISNLVNTSNFQTGSRISALFFYYTQKSSMILVEGLRGEKYKRKKQSIGPLVSFWFVMSCVWYWCCSYEFIYNRYGIPLQKGVVHNTRLNDTCVMDVDFITLIIHFVEKKMLYMFVCHNFVFCRLIE